MVNRLLADAEQARLDAIAANEARYNQLIEGNQAIQNDVLGRMSQLNSQGRTNQANRLSSIEGEHSSAADGALDTLGQYADQSRSLLSGADVPGQYSGRESSLLDRQDAVTEQYGQREQSIRSLFDGLGEQAAADIDERFDNQLGGVRSGAVRRGLFNTTVLNNLERGVNEDRSQELRRLAESLRREEIDLASRLSGDTLASADRGVALAERASGDTADAQDRNLDRGLGLLGALRGDELQTRQTYDLNRLNFLNTGQAQQTALEEAIRSDELGARERLPGNTLGVIERRTDAYPSLTDIANLTLQAGRSDGQAAPVASTPVFTSSSVTRPQQSQGNYWNPVQQQALAANSAMFNQAMNQVASLNSLAAARYGFY